ncbi:MAG: MFS transporter [Opitutales bacterium]|jgi:MFS transporter, FHS family, L-fucose permease|nr:MFS transporter [Opitutales bacterium]MDP4645386.1 MFS transporter [Opitutales bacterium]MDP4692941.1 MFS transporter [Opitutales bacterium]MDP4776372.1 MFS transporter [Opitutales bacterium]MDP4882929.1 MFS transporter [Opitutales bacterium]
MTTDSNNTPVIPRKYLLSFILVTTLFSLWGFANDVTNPLVAVFKDVFVITNAQSTWVQMAFYGGYATMALPAAIFIRRFSYKMGIIVGLSLYAAGALLSIPAAAGANFNLFIIALYILTFGLAFLETTANPFILSMGPPETATRRLNLAQAFNPMGSLTGMFIAGTVILSAIQVEDFKNDVNGYAADMATAEVVQMEYNIPSFLQSKPRERVNDENVKAYVMEKGVDAPATALQDFKDGEIESFQGMTHRELQQNDLKLVAMPYTAIGCIVLVVLVVFAVTKLPHTSPPDADHDVHFGRTVKRLFTNPMYVGGVIAQTFYVGAQIMTWTFIIQYAENELGIDKATAQNFNIMAMVIFLCSRFVCTFFLKYIAPSKLLLLLSAGAIVFTLGAIYLQGLTGLYSLVLISACMSLMFPTIYGLALDGVGEDAKLGSAGLIFAIVGGVFMTRFQGQVLDLDSFMGTTATRGSFFLVVLCFIIIAIYGVVAMRAKAKAVAA